MPLYCYHCDDCNKNFEMRHGMFFEDQRCIYCHSSEIFKVPNIALNSTKTNNTQAQRAGKIVDNYIKDAKEEIKKEKKNMKSEEM